MKEEEKQIQISEHKANMLLTLVREHKKLCKSEDCGVSLYQIYDTFYKPFLVSNNLPDKAKQDFNHFI